MYMYTIAFVFLFNIVPDSIANAQITFLYDVADLLQNITYFPTIAISGFLLVLSYMVW